MDRLLRVCLLLLVGTAGLTGDAAAKERWQLIGTMVLQKQLSQDALTIEPITEETAA